MSDARAATDAGYGIRLIQCHHCDFGSGRRGMDRCSKCDGTGQQWARGGSRFVGTASGFFALLDYCDLAVVPKEPTEEMVEDAAKAIHDTDVMADTSWPVKDDDTGYRGGGGWVRLCRDPEMFREAARAAHSAMLAAAPRP